MQYIPETDGIEYVFINKYSNIQAVTNNKEIVQNFSITTTDKNFNPIIITPSGNKIRLGRDHFSDNVNEPYDVQVCLGARRIYYYEVHYEGNPGKYQTYALGVNDSGIMNFDEKSFMKLSRYYCIPEESDEKPGINTDGQKKLLKAFRTKSIINTYQETFRFTDMYTGFWGIGADQDAIRVLHNK